MLEAETKPPVFIILEFKDQGDVRAISPERAQQKAAWLNAMDDQAIGPESGKRLRPPVSRTHRMSRRAQEALSVLFLWGITTQWCDYDEWSSLKTSTGMLDDFIKDADASIRRAEFKKAESKILKKAYGVAEPYLIDFSEGRSLANDPKLTPGQRSGRSGKRSHQARNGSHL